ncbi:MAG: hypothetical protein HY247_00980 [archaeon]|nr:MAG: hypothetical protein HY247_00980 [archaeon]
MDSVQDFFRHCPQCGRRFHIKVVDEKLLGEEVGKGEEVKVQTRRFGLAPRWLVVGRSRMMELPQGEGLQTPSVVATVQYQYTYKCESCGHEWKEFKSEVGEVMGGEAAGYTGD